jgi:ATP-dependent RNA helicase RhlE
MGFLPDIKRILRHIPSRRQTLFFSATMPAPIGALASEMLKKPATINVQRQSAPPTGITQAAYPVQQDLKAPLLVELLRRNILQQALVFTRTKHRANRLADDLVQQGVKAERIHGNRSQNQRTQALAGFGAGATRCSSRPTSPRADIRSVGPPIVNLRRPADDYPSGRAGRAK